MNLLFTIQIPLVPVLKNLLLFLLDSPVPQTQGGDVKTVITPWKIAKNKNSSRKPLIGPGGNVWWKNLPKNLVLLSLWTRNLCKTAQGSEEKEGIQLNGALLFLKGSLYCAMNASLLSPICRFLLQKKENNGRLESILGIDFRLFDIWDFCELANHSITEGLPNKIQVHTYL